MAVKVLLVGGGITSAVAGNLIRRSAGGRVRLVLWDKARRAGGRMNTSYSRTNEHCTADLGAQYITAVPENLAKHREIYDELLKERLLENLALKSVQGFRQNWPDGTQHYVAPNGTSSLVNHFLKQSKLDEISFQHHVSNITRKQDGLEVETKDGKKSTFDIVILTIPVPQVFQLGGSVNQLINSNEEIRDKLSSVKYSSRYALGLYFGKTEALNSEKWSVRFIDDHPIFRYVAIDHMKRNRPESQAAVTVHTNVTFGAENVDKEIDDVKNILMGEYKKLFPHWPDPENVKCHKWRYSQVTEPYPGRTGYVALSEKPLLILGGDSLTGSGFDNCIDTAEQLAGQVLNSLS